MGCEALRFSAAPEGTMCQSRQSDSRQLNDDVGTAATLATVGRSDGGGMGRWPRRVPRLRGTNQLASLTQASRRSSAALVKVHMLAPRSVSPVSRVNTRSTGPATAKQAWPAESP